ncbi:hypothetical protein NMG60_11035062 [Bertholletia excelsa]
MATNIQALVCHAVAGAASGAIAAIFVCPLDTVKTRFQVHDLPALNNGSTRGGIVRGVHSGLSPTVLAFLPSSAIHFTLYEQLKKKNSLLGRSCMRRSLSSTFNRGQYGSCCCGWSCNNTCYNPLWVAKTRFQTQGARAGVLPYRGTLSALRRIAREEGIRGLYSSCGSDVYLDNIGIIPALAGVSHVAIQFPLYEKIKTYLADGDNTTMYKLSARDVAVASAISKIFATTLTYPHEVVRSKVQVQGHHPKKRGSGVIDCVKRVLQQEGMSGFYCGCATNLLRAIPSAVITFTSFEMIHQFLVTAFPPDLQTQTHKNPGKIK